LIYDGEKRKECADSECNPFLSPSKDHRD
jgi:hypothetical protein